MSGNSGPRASGGFPTRYSAKGGSPSEDQMAEFNEDKEAVPRLMRFTGKQADWQIWSQNFLARATLKKYASVLTGTLKLPVIPMPNTIETTTQVQERQDLEDAFMNANSLGFAELMSSMFDDVSFSIVDKSRTDELPEGDFLLAWNGLKEVFKPSTPASKIMLKKQFYKSKLNNSTRDPDE